MDCCADSGLIKMLPQFVPFIRQHDEGMIDAELSRAIDRTAQARTSGEAFPVVFGIRSATGSNGVQIPQFDTQDGRLD